MTTAWMAQSWSWEGGMRSPKFAEEVMEALSLYHPQAQTDLRLQIRCETHMIDTSAQLLNAVRRFGIDYVIFNNHIDQAVEMADAAPERFANWASGQGRSPKELLTLVRAAAQRGPDVPRHLCRLAEAFDALGVSYGSHDDTDGETRERYSMIGAKIAEFPTTRQAAAAAKAVNDPVLMGAPNVVRGGSQSGNIAAILLIEQGLCDAMVSDYHYPSLARAAWQLVDAELCDLPIAWTMISGTPAQILRLPDRGSIDYGKRADLVVVNAQTRAIEATICGGRLSYLSGEAGRRFLGGSIQLRIAAE